VEQSGTEPKHKLARTGTQPKFDVYIPDGVTYRVIDEICEAPERFTVIFYLDAAPGSDGIAEAEFDVRLTADDCFGVVRAETRAPEGGIIDLDKVRRFQVRPLLREVLRQVVRVPVGVIDDFFTPRLGRKPTTLDRVVIVYSTARLMGEQPTKAVAETLGISRDAAAQQVHRARQKGLLRPTTPGKVH
jgi:hypothetical protein